MAIMEVVVQSVTSVVKEDKKLIYDLLYYSLIEAILVLSIPLASSFVINSVLSHADISIFVLGFVVISLFAIVTILQVAKEYIVEKFQQKIFLTTAIDIVGKVSHPDFSKKENDSEFKKYLNYFFDITAIQKFFPVLLLDGFALIAKILVSLILLWLFDSALFFTGFLSLSVYMIVLGILGKKGVKHAIARSDAKHSAIYFLQNVNSFPGTRDEKLTSFDEKLTTYARARQALFGTTIRQLALTYFMEGAVFSSFLVVGGYLVVEGAIPVGEFIASEIIVVSITYTLKGFVKQLDYVYDTVEGFYKVDKLSRTVSEQGDHHA